MEASCEVLIGEITPLGLVPSPDLDVFKGPPRVESCRWTHKPYQTFSGATVTKGAKAKGSAKSDACHAQQQAKRVARDRAARKRARKARRK